MGPVRKRWAADFRAGATVKVVPRPLLNPLPTSTSKIKKCDSDGDNYDRVT